MYAGASDPCGRAVAQLRAAGESFRCGACTGGGLREVVEGGEPFGVVVLVFVGSISAVGKLMRRELREDEKVVM